MRVESLASQSASAEKKSSKLEFFALQWIEEENVDEMGWLSFFYAVSEPRLAMHMCDK